MSTAIFFTIVLSALSGSLPSALGSAVTGAGAPQLAVVFKSIPPTGAMFAAFLGYNPIGSILAALPAQLLSSIPAGTQAFLTSNTFFPNAIAPAFMSALREAFYIGAALSIVAAAASFLRGGGRPIIKKEVVRQSEPVSPVISSRAESAEPVQASGEAEAQER